MSEPSDLPATVLTAATTPCRVYAVVRAGDWAGDDAGRVADVRLRLVRAGALAVVVADEPAPPPVPAARMLLHETIVDALARRGVVAPVAEGCVAAGPIEVEQWLHAAEPALVGLLDRLEGRCEVGVLAWWDPERAAAAAMGAGSGAFAAPSDGRDAFVEALAAATQQRFRLRAQLAQDPMRSTYLLRRELRARETAAAAAYGERVSAALHARVAAFAEAGRRGGPPGVDVLLDAAYLVHRERLPALDEALADLAQAHGGVVTLRRTAPRVPWRFATLRPFGAPRTRPVLAPATPGGGAS